MAAAARELLERQLGAVEVVAVSHEADRVAFRTSDGCTGDVELVVNWDAVPTESP